MTWGVWALIGVLGSGSAVEAGAGAGSYVPLAFLALQLVVFGLSLTRRFGKPGGRSSDYALGLAAVLALVLWRAMDLTAAFAATVAVVADGLALWPTLRETWRQPRTESLFAWAGDSAAATLGVLAVAQTDYPALAYPLYLAIGNGTVTAVLLIRRLQGRRVEAQVSQEPAGSRSPEALIWSSTDYPYMCLMDEVRTLAFRDAIAATVKPGDVVVDIGSGTGILALFAARAGAGKVHAVETDHTLAEALRRTVQANNFEKVIDVLEDDARTARLPRNVDVVVAELIETGLIDEMQVPVLNSLLARGVIGRCTRLIPEGYTTYVRPIYSDDSYYGLKIAAPKHQWPFYGTPGNGWYQAKWHPLADRQRVVDLEFGRLNSPAVARSIPFSLSGRAPVTGIQLSGTVKMRPGQVLGATHAMNGDKVFVVQPTEHDGRIRLVISYEMGEGMKTLRLACESEPSPRR